MAIYATEEGTTIELTNSGGGSSNAGGVIFRGFPNNIVFHHLGDLTDINNPNVVVKESTYNGNPVSVIIGAKLPKTIKNMIGIIILPSNADDGTYVNSLYTGTRITSGGNYYSYYNNIPYFSSCNIIKNSLKVTDYNSSATNANWPILEVPLYHRLSASTDISGKHFYLDTDLRNMPVLSSMHIGAPWYWSSAPFLSAGSCQYIFGIHDRPSSTSSHVASFNYGPYSSNVRWGFICWSSIICVYQDS